MFEDGRCPNCGTALPGGAKYCAKCGYGTKDGKPKRVPFPWILIGVLMFLVPLAACGGCLAFGATFDHQKEPVTSIAATFFFSSIGIAILMIIINIAVNLWRNGK